MLLRDFRFAARMLAENRGFTAVSVLCLALSIAANSTIFSLVDGFWTRPLPVRDPGGLLHLSTATPASPRGGISYADFLDYRSGSTCFTGLLASERRGPILIGDGFAESTMSNVVSENYFTVLGVNAQVGRTFTDADANTGQRVVVMSHNLWQRRYGGDPAVVGRSIRLSGSYIVIGVAPKGFRGTELWQDSDFWIPMSSWDIGGQDRTARDRRNNTVLGRLREGVSIEAARTELAGIAASLARQYPKTNKDRRAVLLTTTEHLFATTKQLPFILLGVVALVLLIACANLANLLLARAGARAREIGVRLALGASRGRLVSQLMAESILLCALGTGFGLLLAMWLISLLPAVIIPPASSVARMEFRLDHRVLAFTLITSVVTVFVFGLAPALRAARTDLLTVLKGDSGAGTQRGRVRPRSVLAMVQMALSVVLLVSAGLLVRTLFHSLSLDLGFERHNILVAEVSPPYDGEPVRAFYRQLVQRLKAMPTVRDATVAVRAPLSLSGGTLSAPVAIPARAPATIEYTAVGPGYFHTLGIPFLRGRDFDAHDGSSMPRVAIISDSMSRRFWPGEDPVGRVIQMLGAERTIVGVVGDTRTNTIIEAPEPYVYLPHAQSRFSSMYVMASTNVDALEWARQLRTEVAAVDSHVPVLEVTTMSLLARAQVYEQQVSATVIGGLGVIGLFLAAVGLYGLISYSVTQRTREIGIRMALGAPRRSTMSLVMRHALALAVAGAAIGLIGAALTAQLLSGLLFEISVHDPLTYACVALCLLGVAALASYIPALRSTRIDPMTALRHD